MLFIYTRYNNKSTYIYTYCSISTRYIHYIQINVIIFVNLNQFIVSNLNLLDFKYFLYLCFCIPLFIYYDFSFRKCKNNIELVELLILK